MKKKLVIVEVKEFLNSKWKYKNNKLYKLHKQTKDKWICLNDLKPDTKGYIRVNVNISFYKIKRYYLNRLVYYFHHQDWNIHDSSSNNQIDHRNQNKLDNSIENLKIVNNSQNCQNINIRKGKEVKGVYFRKDKNRTKPWVAKWRENNKQKTKGFATEEEALQHRQKMVQLYYYQG